MTDIARDALTEIDESNRVAATALAACTTDRGRRPHLATMRGNDVRLIRALRTLAVAEDSTPRERRRYERWAANIAEALCDPDWGEPDALEGATIALPSVWTRPPERDTMGVGESDPRTECIQ